MPRQSTRIIKDSMRKNERENKGSNHVHVFATADSFMYSQSAIKKSSQTGKGIPDQIIFWICLLDWFLLLNSSLSFLKSASQWVTKCEICVLTFLTNHLTAKVQTRIRALVSGRVTWWLFLTHQNRKRWMDLKVQAFKCSQLIKVILTYQFDLCYVWLWM